MRRKSPAREVLIQTLGSEIVSFQDATNAFDRAAAEVLALGQGELAAMSALLFGGPLAPEAMRGVLRLPARACAATIERLELAGYVRPIVGNGRERIELTEHARRWIETLWGPLAAEGAQILARQSVRDLRAMARLMATIRPVHEAHAARVRSLLDVPRGSTPSPRRRGGLSPAALRRVQLFAEANLERPITLRDLAMRAGLSAFHFARAFKTSMGTTPRAFVESRRIEKARALLRGSSLSLAQVAHATGLGTQSRFTTTFRRATGLTPATYRRGATADDASG